MVEASADFKLGVCSQDQGSYKFTLSVEQTEILCASGKLIKHKPGIPHVLQTLCLQIGAFRSIYPRLTNDLSG